MTLRLDIGAPFVDLHSKESVQQDLLSARAAPPRGVLEPFFHHKVCGSRTNV